MMVVHFDDFEVEAVSQDFRRFASEPEKGVDAGGVVGGPNYGNLVDQRLDGGAVFFSVSSGADDDGFGLGGGFFGDFLGGIGDAEVNDDVGGCNGRRDFVADVYGAGDFELGMVCGAANQRSPHSSFGSDDGQFWHAKWVGNIRQKRIGCKNSLTSGNFLRQGTGFKPCGF